jgi:hypothetical protein
MNLNNAVNTPDFITKPCALCGLTVRGDMWYALIGDRPVHSSCYAASKAVGHTLPLLPKI